jgi:hypothetical protein
MAKLARMEAQTEILVARNNTSSAGDTEGLLRGRVAELLRLNPEATIADIDTSLKSALTERDALKSELDALRAEDNRIAGLIGSAEAAIDEGRLAEARDYLDQAIAVHDERERAARTAKAGLLAAKARTAIIGLDYRLALHFLDQSASAEVNESERRSRQWQAARTANEWGERSADPAALPDAIRRWQTLVTAYAADGDDANRAVHVGGVEILHLGLGDLFELFARDLADLVEVRLGRTLVDLGGLLQQHSRGRRLEHEGEGLVGEGGDHHRQLQPRLVALRLGVERLAELHDVQAALAKCRPDRRRRIGLAGRYLQLDEADYFLCHEWLLNRVQTPEPKIDPKLLVG